MKSNFKRICLVYFSPTKTTKTILMSIAKGTGINNVISYDFTSPKSRESVPDFFKDDLIIFGIPTYAGRIPNLILSYIKSFKASHISVIPVVTFGNRAFDNSLYELKEVLKEGGFSFLAAAAFSTEHSFSSDINKGRPNEKDLREAEMFGQKLLSLPIKEDLDIPGNLEEGYFKPQDRNGNPINILKVKPKTKSNCTNCKICVNICPMGVIDKDNPSTVNDPCIKCNACVRFCPNKSKYFDDSNYKYHVDELIYLYGSNPKENSFFY